MIMAFAAGVAAICGAIVAVGPAWDKIEPHVPASAGWIREHVSSSRAELEEKRIKPLESDVMAQNLSVERLIKYQLEENLARTARDPAIKNSPIVQERRNELQRQIQDTDKRIQSMEQKGKGQK